MRVLISGGLGFIGGFMTEAFAEAGHEVAIVDDRRSSVVEPDEVPCDLYSPLEVSDFVRGRGSRGLNVDAVIHCASPVGSAGVLPERGLIVPQVVESTTLLVDACIKDDIPLVNISTSEVYGFSGTYSEINVCEVPVRPSARLEYAVAKLAGEYVVMNSIHRGLKAVSIRPFNVAGPRQRSDKGFVLPTFVEQALASKPLTIFGDGSQQRAFTSVTDVCRFVRDFLFRDLSNFDGRSFNVGNPNNQTTVNALAHRVCEQLGVERKFVNTNGKAIHGPDYEEAEGYIKTPNISRARSLGWEPQVGLAKLIDQTASFYKDEPRLVGV